MVCYPRTPAAAARLGDRAQRLRIVSALGLGVEVPEPIAESAPGEPPYLVLSRIAGEPLQPAFFGDPHVAEQCGRLLARLQRAGADPAVRAALPVAGADRWRQFADAVRAELYPRMSTAGRDRAEDELAAAATLPDLTAAVVHGDLGGENLLWRHDADGPCLSGVIDWDSVMLGDPAEDIAALAASFGPPVLEHLAGSDPLLLGRVAAIRATFALQQALDGHLDGDEAELATGLAGYV